MAPSAQHGAQNGGYNNEKLIKFMGSMTIIFFMDLQGWPLIKPQEKWLLSRGTGNGHPLFYWQKQIKEGVAVKRGGRNPFPWITP